jgi:broad-specificity NMP kinase
MLLVCLYGAPGVGKLSVGRHLEDAMGYQLVHDHLTIETAATIFPFGTDGFSRLRSSLFRTLLDAACTTGKGIVVTHADDIFWDPPFESILRSSVDSHDYLVKRVFLQCSEIEHERRISDSSRAQYRKIRSLDRLRSLVDQGEFKTTHARGEDLVLDTSEISAWETARQIELWLQPSARKARVA